MNKIEFQTKLKQWFSWLKEEDLQQFEIYKNFVQEQNKLFNLTRLDQEDKIYEEFFLDSLVPYKDLNVFSKDKSISLLDIGSGSGIPGIVLKLVYPSIQLTLLEANAKRCMFLEMLVAKLNLKDVQIWNMRAEDLTVKMRESFDVTTSRAVASLHKILEISTPFTKVDGLVIQTKSNKFFEEEQEALGTINKLFLNKIAFYEINETNHTHNVVVYKKTQKTSHEFPRSWSLISKKPL